MTDMMKLAIGWTIVGGFVFTMIVTLLSLVGWIKFADPSQQKKLFATLIIGVVVAAGAGLIGGAKLDPAPVADGLREEGATVELVGITKELLGSPERAAAVDKEVLSRLVGRIPLRAGTPQEREIHELRAKVDALPAGKLSPEAAKTIRESTVLQPAAHIGAHRLVPNSP